MPTVSLGSPADDAPRVTSKILTLALSLKAEEGGGVTYETPPDFTKWAGTLLQVQQMTVLATVATTAISVPSGAKHLVILFGSRPISLTLKGAGGDTGIVLADTSANTGAPVSLPLVGGTTTLYLVTAVGSAGGPLTLVFS